jgi:hypothetical protein
MDMKCFNCGHEATTGGRCNVCEVTLGDERIEGVRGNYDQRFV